MLKFCPLSKKIPAPFSNRCYDTFEHPPLWLAYLGAYVLIHERSGSQGQIQQGCPEARTAIFSTPCGMYKQIGIRKYVGIRSRQRACVKTLPRFGAFFVFRGHRTSVSLVGLARLAEQSTYRILELKFQGGPQANKATQSE